MGSLVKENLSKDGGHFAEPNANKLNTQSYRDRVNHFAKSSREYVTENPVKGIALAVTTGALVGSIFTLAMRRGK